MPELDLQSLGTLEATATGAARYKILLVGESAGVSAAALQKNRGYAGAKIVVDSEARDAGGKASLDLAPMRGQIEEKLKALAIDEKVASFVIGFPADDGGEASAVAGPSFTWVLEPEYNETAHLEEAAPVPDKPAPKPAEPAKPPAGPVRDRILSVAKAELNVREDVASDTDSGGRIRQFFKVCTGKEMNAAYCAAFVSYCYVTAGATIPKTASAPKLQSNFVAAGRFFEDKASARPGDVVFFKKAATGRCGHVGILEKIEGGAVHTIEGNTWTNLKKADGSPLQGVFRRKPQADRVMGFGRAE